LRDEEADGQEERAKEETLWRWRRGIWGIHVHNSVGAIAIQQQRSAVGRAWQER